MALEIIDDRIHLETEAEAWDLLRRLVDGELEVPRHPKVTVGAWAKVDVYLPSDKYDSALTPYMMQGWVELQRSVYRTYAAAATGLPDGKKLSDSEKEKLELIVEVKSGSSDQAVDVTAILTQIGLALVGKMEPTHVLIGIIAVALTLGGASVTRVWLNGKKEVKLAEIERPKSEATVRAQVQSLQTIAEVAGVERERAKLLARAKSVVPLIGDIEAEADAGRGALLHHVTKQDAVVNGVAVSAAAGQTVTRKTRIEASDVRLDGLYRIKRVDTTVSTGFRVQLVNQKGEELVADVAEVMTTLEDRAVIRDAEWEKLPAFFQINAKERRGGYADAVILRARKHDADTDGPWTA